MKQIQAYRLGDESPTEVVMIRAGKIKPLPNGTYKLFSQDAAEVAKTGDYFRLDAAGYPYPCAKAWFEANYSHVSGDIYVQRKVTL